MQIKYYAAAACLIALAAGIAVYISSGYYETGPQVVSTTSVLSSAAEEIAGERVRTATLVPPGSCPGHFDIKVQHLRLLEESGFLLAHGFEEYLPDIRRSVSNPDFEPAVVLIEGSWLVPEGMESLYQQTAEHLTRHLPGHGEYFRERLSEALGRIREADGRAGKLSAAHDLDGRPVICNAHMAGYLRYLGFDVVATYGRSEDLDPAGIGHIIRLGREKNVALVVDNMQAGADTGKVFADELGIPHAAVSNFPAVLPGADTLYDTLLANMKILIGALEER